MESETILDAFFYITMNNDNTLYISPRWLNPYLQPSIIIIFRRWMTIE